MIEASIHQMTAEEIARVEAYLTDLQTAHRAAIDRKDGSLFIDATMRLIAAVMATVEPPGRVLIMMRIASMADRLTEAPTTNTQQ